MKELINHIMEPIYSFPMFCIMFFLMMKNYKVVGTKKFLVLFLCITLPIVAWFLSDPNFLAIVLFPDNVPISILIVLVVATTWYSLFRAANNDTRIENGEVPIEGLPENREKVWSWPNLVYTELFVIIAGTVFLIAWAIIFKAPLEEPANPTWAPNPAKAPWYFLGLQEMLVYFDPWMAGVVIPGVIVVGLIAIPYIDTNPKGNGYYTLTERKMAIPLFLFGWLSLWFFLIIIGVFMRGPNWTFYGPFEFWDFHKVVAEYNVNLSEFFWIKWLNTSLPKNILLREWFGIFLVALYQTVPTLIWAKTKHGLGLIEKVGKIRFYILVFLVLGMGSLPIKMFLRWLFGLKYVIAMPEFELNL